MAAKNQQTCYIGFDGHQVAVHSDIPEVLRYLEFNFSQMLVSPLDVVVAQVKVWRKEEKYWLKVNHEVTAKGRTLDQVLSLLKYQVALHLIEARPDLLWLHAGAVAYQNNAVLISGVSGRGKSTTVTNLCAKGWQYLADDVIPLDQTSERVIPFPQTPMARINPGRQVLNHQTLPKTQFILRPEMVCRNKLPLKAIIFPEFSFGGGNSLNVCSPAVAAVNLIQNSLNYIEHQETAIDCLVELVKRVPAYQLTFDNEDVATELIRQRFNKGILFA